MQNMYKYINVPTMAATYLKVSHLTCIPLKGWAAGLLIGILVGMND